jgi:cell wall-associated NlpC family hydrolase
MRESARASRLVVTAPVADLRREPVDAGLVNVHDELQETQLLFNELLILKDEEKDWLRVEAVEQWKSSGEGHIGWVRKHCIERIETPPEYNAIVRSAFIFVMDTPSSEGVRLFPLSLGTRLLLTGVAAKGFSEIALPGGETGWAAGKDLAARGKGAGRRPATAEEIVETARLFLGAPYLWGGRTMPLPGVSARTGVDCSGLVNLSFRVHGIEIPRDAHQQWLSGSPIDAGDMGPGDLVFVSREGEADSINHVMLSLGGENLVEAPNTGDVVRIRTFPEKFGLDLARLREHDFVVNRRKLYFGRMASIPTR